MSYSVRVLTALAAALLLSAVSFPLLAQSTSTGAAVTITVTSSANPSVFGTPVTFTVVVAGPASASPVPTGTVTAAFPGPILIGAATLDSTGKAVITVPEAPSPLFTFPWGLPAGSDNITFTYSGDKNYKSTQYSYNQFVNKANTSTTATEKSSITIVVLTATVSIDPASASATQFALPGTSSSDPTGTVQFFDGKTSLGTAALSPSGLFTSTANLVVTTVPASLIAAYSGDSNYNGSTSPPVVGTGKGAVTLNITSSANPSTFAEPVTFTVAVAPASSGGATPTGTVSASLLGLFNLGSATLDTSGTGKITVPSGAASAIPWGLPAGTDSITFSYGGDANYSSLQTSFTQTVDKAATTNTATVSPSAMSITATVAIDEPSVSKTAFAVPGAIAISASPTGLVQFLNGSTVIGTAPLIPNGLFQSAATLMVGQPFSSSDVLTAVYNGDADYTGSTSSAATIPVLTSVTISVNSSANPSTFAEPVTLSITVTGATSGSVPTGTVQASVLGADILGVATLDSTGKASIEVPSQIPVTVTPFLFPWGLAPGTNNLTVSYSGDNTYASGKASLSQVGNLANTSTTVLLAPVPTNATTFPIVATVSIDEPSVSKTDFRIPAPGDVSTSPSGMVQFYDGATLLGAANLRSTGLFQSAATFEATAVPSSARAVYPGDTNYNGSSSPSETLGNGAVTVTLQSSGNPTTYGAALTIVATVTPATAGGPTPTGTVEFFDGTQNLNWKATLDGSGKATLQFPLPLATPLVCFRICPSAANAEVLGAGSNSITAQYSGDVNYAAATSTTPLVQQITKAPTATSVFAFQAALGIISEGGVTATVADSQPPSGGPYHFRAITGSGTTDGDPSGTVTFYSGSASIGTGTLVPSPYGNVASTASLNLNGITTSGDFSASYPGDANFQASTSPTPSATSTSLTSTPNPSNTGQPVTLTATITTPSASPAPTGKVTFLDGITVLGISPVSGGTATLTTTFLKAGSHSLTAVYSGDQTYQGSTSPVVVQVVNATTTPTDTLELTVSTTTAVYGQNLVLLAQVAGNVSAAPTGTVTFLDGSKTLGTAPLFQSTAYLVVTLAVGTHQISATWPGDSNWPAAASAVVNVVVTPANTQIALRNFGTVWTAVVFPVPPGEGTPTGTVQFVDTITKAVLATVTLNNGVASTNIASDTDPVEAIYSGDSNFNASQSRNVTPQPRHPKR